MDDLAAILARKDYDEPQEITIIKRYVSEHFKADVHVQLHPHTITVKASSAALIGQLRMHIVDIQRACQTDKKIILRIG